MPEIMAQTLRRLHCYILPRSNWQVVFEGGTTVSHPTYALLSAVIERYPHVAGATFQTYNDLLLAQQWSEMEVVDLPQCGRCGFRGRRPENQNTPTIVVPCLLTETITMDWLKSTFSDLDNPGEVFLAICAEDSSIVYYKMSMGINKPPV
ncbi:tRNA intron endonuclease [Russula earlei]|uniref:tRNA intron endonuclease n=1 Tax=Russula earlei TaxID=71964 RepID=A0ACC0U7M7_9AGAM|nr:tRNA intron endonuclease [Russula earlei]